MRRFSSGSVSSPGIRGASSACVLETDRNGQMGPLESTPERLPKVGKRRALGHRRAFSVATCFAHKRAMVNTRSQPYSPELAQRTCVSNTFASSCLPPDWLESRAGRSPTTTSAGPDPAANVDTEHAHPLVDYPQPGPGEPNEQAPAGGRAASHNGTAATGRGMPVRALDGGVHEARA